MLRGGSKGAIIKLVTARLLFFVVLVKVVIMLKNSDSKIFARYAEIYKAGNLLDSPRTNSYYFNLYFDLSNQHLIYLFCEVSDEVTIRLLSVIVVRSLCERCTNM